MFSFLSESWGTHDATQPQFCMQKWLRLCPPLPTGVMWQGVSRWQIWQRNWQSYRVRRCIVAECSIRPDHTIMFAKHCKTIFYSQDCALARLQTTELPTWHGFPCTNQPAKCFFFANAKKNCCIYHRCCRPACLNLNQCFPEHCFPSWFEKKQLRSTKCWNPNSITLISQKGITNMVRIEWCWTVCFPQVRNSRDLCHVHEPRFVNKNFTIWIRISPPSRDRRD